MNIQKFMAETAKGKSRFPLELKVLYFIVMYVIAGFITIGDSVLFLISLIQKLTIIVVRFLRISITNIVILKRKTHQTITDKKQAFNTHFYTLPAKFSFSFPKKPHKKKSRKKKFPLYTPPLTLRQKIGYFSAGTFFSALFFFLPMLFLIFVQSLPSPYELTIRDIPQTTKILDRNGTLLTQIYASQNRTIVKLSDIPDNLQHATLAIEDKNFYSHPGVDIISIIRALKENFTGGTFQGGSTITQQLIKSAMLTPEPSLMRKTKEIVLAFWAERIYSKNQILQMYFNQVPYGGTAWGVEAAAEVYLGKPVKDLDLAESAFLAGLTQAPTVYSPYGENPTAWKTRQKEVLSRMVSLHYISQEQADAAAKETITFKSEESPNYAPHFVNYIESFLAQKYGLATIEKGGLTVITSLDVPTQQMAQQVVKDEVNKDAYLNLTNGAAIITNPQNGDILAMVGSKDFSDPNFGKVNVATSSRQPGSSIKVVTYSAALSHGLTAASIIEDRPTAFAMQNAPAYTPVNYDGHYFGKIPLRFALANSLNVPAVKVLQQVGIPTMVNLAKDMGVRSWGDPNNYGLSVTLGGSEVTMLDMATVYGTLANQGNRVDVNPILKITDSSGKVYEEKTVTPRQVLSSDVAFIMSDILADAQTRSYAFGPHSPLEIPGHTVSVKTGTTDNKKDNWTDGYTNNFVVIVWVGNNNGEPMSPTLASGITGAAPIWNKLMTNLLNKQPETRFSMPVNVTQRPCLGRVEYFVKGTENLATCGNQPNNNNNTYSAFSLPTH